MEVDVCTHFGRTIQAEEVPVRPLYIEEYFRVTHDIDHVVKSCGNKVRPVAIDTDCIEGSYSYVPISQAAKALTDLRYPFVKFILNKLLKTNSRHAKAKRLVQPLNYEVHDQYDEWYNEIIKHKPTPTRNYPKVSAEQIVNDQPTEAQNPLIRDMNYLYIPNVAICSNLVDVVLELHSSSDLDMFTKSLTIPTTSVLRGLRVSLVHPNVVIPKESLIKFFAVLASPSSQSYNLKRLDIQYVNLSEVIDEVCATIRQLESLEEVELCNNKVNDKTTQVFDNILNQSPRNKYNYDM